MRTRFWKLSALVLALMIALTGCSLIEIDQEMDMAEVVAEVNGTKITKGEVIDVYNYQLEYMTYMYSMYMGTTALTNDQIATVKDDVLESFIEVELLRQKAEELGLTDFSDESFAEVDAEAEAYFEELLTQHDDHLSVEGLTEEAAREARIAHLASEGTTLDAVKENYRSSHVSELVYEHVTSSLEVTEDELKAAYDAQVASDEETYSSSTYLYETYQTYGDTIAWNPEGYRTVKHILFLLDDEQSAALTNLNTQLADVEASILALESADETETEADAEAETEDAPAKTAEELNAEKASLEQQIADKEAEILASFQEKTDAVYARLDAGESFDDLMAELGEDPGMQSDPSMTNGYYVCATSSTWDTNFRDAAMAIPAIGETSEPVLSSSGVHIIYYNSDVTPGAVDIETVREALTEEALTAKQEEAYAAQYEEWKAAASIKKYPKVLG